MPKKKPHLSPTETVISDIERLNRLDYQRAILTDDERTRVRSLLRKYITHSDLTPRQWAMARAIRQIHAPALHSRHGRNA